MNEIMHGYLLKYMRDDIVINPQRANSTLFVTPSIGSCEI